MTAQCFSVNSNNDIYLGVDGNLAVVYNLQGTLQACAHASKTILGEMIFASNQGLPNFQLIWVGVPNLPQYEAAVRNALQAIAGVQQILSFSSTLSNNILNYTVTIQTIYGIGTIEGSA